MSDLVRLDEAIGTGETFRDRIVHEFPQGVFDVLLEAARAYRDFLAGAEKRWHCEQGNAYYGPCEPETRGLRDSEGRDMTTQFAPRHQQCGWFLFVGPLEEET